MLSLTVYDNGSAVASDIAAGVVAQEPQNDSLPVLLLLIMAGL